MTVPVDTTAGSAADRRADGLRGDRWLRDRPRPGWPLLIGLVLGLLALGPGLARGFLLDYDMVFVPRPPFSMALLGATGGPARAVPSDAVVTVLAQVIPADIVQKLILLAIFALACSGAARLMGDGWRLATGQPAPLLASVAAGVFYTWNPYVAERLLIGQWALLLGYAGLPWVLRVLCTDRAGPDGAGIRIWPLCLAVLPAAVGGFAAMAVTAVAAVPAALARGQGRARLWRLVTVVVVLAAASLPWAVPSLLVPVHADPAGVQVFHARADTPFGGLGSLVMLSGIWNSSTVPAGYGGGGSASWLLVVLVAIACYLLRARPARLAAGVGWAGIAGLAVAAAGVMPAGRTALADLVTAWPGFAILRDGQQFVGPLGLTEAIGMGTGVAWLLSPSGRPDDTADATARFLPRQERSGTRTGAASARAAMPLAVIAAVAPIVLLPGMAWGLAGRLHPVQYPADWLRARQVIDGSPRPGTVLLLPWGTYRKYAWNDENVFDPWSRLLSREVIFNDGLQVGRVRLAQESAAAIRMNAIVTRPGPLTARLESAGVSYVIIDSGPLLGSPVPGLARRARLPGAAVLVDSRDLVLLGLPDRGS
ncbi:MAG TPA: hypothetical protein VEL03_18030 [Streptosporangiaceae bacterium]|nr:hypothetical protein [Streptosporangiaceae bacterium]